MGQASPRGHEFVVVFWKQFFLDRADTNKVGKPIHGKNTWKDFTKHIYDLQVSVNAEKRAYANNIMKLYLDKFPATNAVNIRGALQVVWNLAGSQCSFPRRDLFLAQGW